VLPIRCSYCGAHAEEPCRTHSGVVTRTHALRWAEWESGRAAATEANVIDFTARRIEKLARENGFVEP
jgi:hypothetical protein